MAVRQNITTAYGFSLLPYNISKGKSGHQAKVESEIRKIKMFFLDLILTPIHSLK